MSKRVINPNQLQMLMKPSEIRNSLTHSVDYQYVEDPTADWEEKKTTMLKDNIAKNGIKNPVILDHSYNGPGTVSMGNGHHRVQAAKEIEDSGKEIYVPVLHTSDDYMGFQSYKEYPELRDPYL